MNKKTLILILLFVFLSGCIGTDKTALPAASAPSQNEPAVIADDNIPVKTPVNIKESNLLIDRISENMRFLHGKGWNDLYQADELDCSRMSTYLWNYIRSNYHVAPKIIVSYERQHAWLALKVSDVGNSADYRHWNIKGTDYYYLEATMPKLVADDNLRFLVNGQEYTSAEFYEAPMYVFDTPQDANDFHADYSMMGGWNQEFRLRKGDMDKIEGLMK